MSKPSSSFVSNVLKLTTGSGLSQGLAILVAPIVTRLFAPEAFGIAALFTSITAVIGVLTCLGYEFSIMLPKTDEEASNLLAVSVCSVLIISIVTALIIFLTGDLITILLNAPKLKEYLWMIPIAVFTSGLFLSFNYWNSRTKHFGRLSIAQILSSGVSQTTKLGAGFAGFVSGGVLIGARILGSILSTGFLGCKIWQNDRALFQGSIRLKGMIAGIKRYKKFPIYSTWSALLNTASQQFPALFLAFFFSPSVVGFFALGREVLNLPMNLVGQAIGQVFFQKASEAKRQGQLGQVVEGVFQRLVSLGMFPFLLLMLIGKDLFSFVFGTQWAEAGVYIQMLSPWIFFTFISSPLSTLFSVLEAQREQLVFNILLFLSRAIALGVGGISGNPRIAVGLFSIIGVIGCSWICFWVLYKAKVNLGKSMAVLAQHCLLSFPLLGTIFWFHYVMRYHFLITLGIGLFCAILYYAVIVYRDISIRTQLLMLLKTPSQERTSKIVIKSERLD